MSLSDLAALGSFVSGFAVLVSLIFLFFQLRQVDRQFQQSEKNQRAVIRQVAASRAVDYLITVAATPALAEAIANCMLGKDGASPADITQFTYYCRGVFNSLQDMYLQHRDGLVTQITLDEVAHNMRGLIAGSPGFRAQFRMQRGIFEPGFAAWMEKLVTETPHRAPADLTESWANALAAERAAAS